MYDRAGVGQSVVIEVEGSGICRLESTDGILRELSHIELITLDTGRGDRVLGAVLEAILHRRLDSFAAGGIEEVNGQISRTDISGVVVLDGDVLTCRSSAESRVAGRGGFSLIKVMVEQDGKILRSTPCLTFLILSGLGSDLGIRAGSIITGVMLYGQRSGARSRLGIVAEASGINEDDAAPSGNAVGTGSGTQRSSARLGAVRDNGPRTAAGDALRGSGVVQRDDDLVPLSGLVVGDLPSGAAGNGGNSVRCGVAESGNSLADRDKTRVIICNLSILGSAVPVESVHIVG